jgi:hypothetical protein
VNIKKLKSAFFSSSGVILAIGLLTFALSAQIFYTGRIREYFPIGEARVPISLLLCVFGIWVTYVGVKSIVNVYRK